MVLFLTQRGTEVIPKAGYANTEVHGGGGEGDFVSLLGFGINF
jgi:hypothetical protein